MPEDKGYLTKEEQEVLDSLLYDFHIKFVAKKEGIKT